MSGRLRGLLIGALTLAVCLLVAELILRRVHPVGGHIYRLDAELLFDAQPGARTVQRMPARTLKPGDSARHLVTINARGFRGPELAEPKDGPRVLVLGDSYVMAENVAVGATFAARLGVELGAELGVLPPEAVNGGRSGYGPDQALLLLERELDALQPDLVVCVLSAHNDLGDLARNKLFRLGEDGDLVAGRPDLGARVREQFRARGEQGSRPVLVRLLARALAPPRRGSVAGRADLIPRYLEALEAQFAESSQGGRAEVVSLFEDVYDADVATDPKGAAAAAKTRLMGAIVRRMLAACGAVPVRFVIVPSAVDLCPGFGLRVDPGDYPGYRPGALAAALVQAVEGAEGAALDLTEGFTGDDSDPAPDRYFVGGLDPHWNAAGQALAARLAARWLAADPGASNALRR